MADVQQFVTWQSVATFVGATTTTTLVTASIVSLCKTCQPKWVAVIVALALVIGFTLYLDLAIAASVSTKQLIFDLAIALINGLVVYSSVLGIKAVDFSSPTPKGGGPPVDSWLRRFPRAAVERSTVGIG